MSERRLAERFAFGPVAAVRPWLFAKALYLLLAFDVWHTLVGPAWRYGAAGFNVAHFAVLDALPLPSTEAYVGMLVVVGAMAFVAALLPRPPRLLPIAITVLYTWGWSCSMLDSYQHHYLLSALLGATCLFPGVTARDLFGASDVVPSAAPAAPAKRGKKGGAVAPRPAPSTFPHGLVARVRSLGWTMVTTFSGIVYTFTAISKTEPEWRSGDALRNITHEGATMRAPMDFAESLGLDADTVFHLMGTGMIAVQVVCALGYLTASLRDGPPTAAERAGLDAAWAALTRDRTWVVIRGVVVVLLAVGVGVSLSWVAALALFTIGITLGMPTSFVRFAFAPLGRARPLSLLASLALALALSFHVGAEYIGLQIGWFSYYMIALALVALTPAHWLAALAAVASAPSRTREPSMLAGMPLLAPILGLTTAGIAAFAGVEIDLPGSYAAAMAVGLVALALGLGAMFRPDLRDPLGRAAGVLGIAMLSCWFSMTHGTARYDFYRFAGGDFRRRGEHRAALEAYREANRYAPPGGSREDRVHEMEEAIRREGGTP